MICVYLELSDRFEILRRHQRHVSNFNIGHVLKPKVKPEIMLAISRQTDYVFPTVHFCYNLFTLQLMGVTTVSEMETPVTLHRLHRGVMVPPITVIPTVHCSG